MLLNLVLMIMVGIVNGVMDLLNNGVFALQIQQTKQLIFQLLFQIHHIMLILFNIVHYNLLLVGIIIMSSEHLLQNHLSKLMLLILME